MALRGIGIDMVEIRRVREALDRNPHFADKLFTPGEIAYCESMARRETHYAARFAAKEAFFKALGTGWRLGMGWQEVDVRHDELGKPLLHLSGRTAEEFRRRRLRCLHLSITHERNQAVAVVVVE
ncbi:MAG: holo-ACP synthase [Acidobacteriota bacterium]|jgi:holo-[acyl-carrier protein] synthase|nr:holo-ACP synthase [Acidobacteriota bacterium]